LIVLGGGQLRIAGHVEDLLATHRLLTGPAAEADRWAERLTVVQDKRAASQAHLLVAAATADDPVPPGWEAHPVSLEELTLAYLRATKSQERQRPTTTSSIEVTEAAR
jgi:ABC-2 type transport system ATP-binding protein